MRLVERITLVNAAGKTTTVYKRKRKKRRNKVSTWARPLARAERAILEAQETFFSEARKKQAKSNRKRRNGFLRDGALNYTDANQKAWRVLLRKAFG